VALTGTRRRRERIIRHTLLALLVWLAAAAAPVIAAPPSAVERALAGAARIDVYLSWPDRGTINVHGTGWTRGCNREILGWSIVVATAAHVIDLADLERELGDGEPAERVRVVVSYADGTELVADRDDLSVDLVHDYGEVRLSSLYPRPALPIGHPELTLLGTPLFTVACPGNVRFGLYEGSLTLLPPLPVRGAPETSWLSSIPIGPGASGAPVLDADGQVVATVVGLVNWRWGGSASIIVPLPEAQKRGSK